MSGSGETLQRGIYEYHNPFSVKISASLRMVADLADTDKVMAVLSGGVSARLFHKHNKDQVEAFLKGDKIFWWFSDKMIQENSKYTLLLNPSKK